MAGTKIVTIPQLNLGNYIRNNRKQLRLDYPAVIKKLDKKCKKSKQYLFQLEKGKFRGNAFEKQFFDNLCKVIGGNRIELEVLIRRVIFQERYTKLSKTISLKRYELGTTFKAMAEHAYISKDHFIDIVNNKYKSIEADTAFKLSVACECEEWEFLEFSTFRKEKRMLPCLNATLPRLGKFIRFHRVRRGLTQLELANSIGCTEQKIQSLETKIIPNVSNSICLQVFKFMEFSLEKNSECINLYNQHFGY